MKITLFIPFLFVMNLAFSQHDHSGHSHESETITPLGAPPHKGVVKQAGKYYIEVVSNWMASKNNTVIYLLKSSGVAVVNEKITCTLTTIKETIKEDKSVIQWGGEAFATQLDPLESYEVEITFFIKKKKYTAVFQTKGNNSKKGVHEDQNEHQHHH